MRNNNKENGMIMRIINLIQVVFNSQIQKNNQTVRKDKSIGHLKEFVIECLYF